MQIRCALFLLLVPMLWGCNKLADSNNLRSGVSLELASSRAKSISNLTYEIRFSIPNDLKKSVIGRNIISFDFKNEVQQVVLDFTGDVASIKSIRCNGKEVKYKLANEHIVIRSRNFKKRSNRIEVEFIAGDKALNRKEDLMYTLFVPDRARTVFPCFDQPDLKARFYLELEIPRGWSAISNADISDSTVTSGNRTTLKFAKSDLISTYLFSFTAGKFHKAQKEIKGKIYNILYRENDERKVAQNLDSIFYMVDYSVKWMEQYTGILQPFSKYDLAIIPYFQFSGMEHPGSVYYVESKMFLSENATLPERLARAELIAHETAHLWFGDLVTMRWFNDVWMKEVFAGFFADKIVKELFLNVNSDLQFMIAHTPKAYSEDRTKGANPIRQQLDNLNLAGTMYGNIIYHKAPIAIRSLETLMGKNAFQISLREYLKEYSLGNADWNDLVKIFDRHARFSVKDWSKSWIEGIGMPSYTYSERYSDSVGSVIALRQINPNINKQPYLQLLEFSELYSDGTVSSKSTLFGKKEDAKKEVVLGKSSKTRDCIIANSNGFGYGYFELDSNQCASVAGYYQLMKNPVHRVSSMINLYENTLNGNFDGRSMLMLLCQAIKTESNAQVVSFALDYLFATQLYFISDEDTSFRDIAESTLWTTYSKTNNAKLQVLYLRALAKMMRSEGSAKKILQIWKGEALKVNSWLSEIDRQDIALELCIRLPEETELILDLARKSTKNADNLRRFNFISKAISPEKIVRDKFFEKLLHVENRKQEAWVADALKLLNHPLRSDESKVYIAKGLMVLPEIQKTGDIFFPKSWIISLLYGHTSFEDYQIVKNYINKEGRSLSASLLLKLQQGADMLERSSGITQRKVKH